MNDYIHTYLANYQLFIEYYLMYLSIYTMYFGPFCLK